jgi:hypothetical protein
MLVEAFRLVLVRSTASQSLAAFIIIFLKEERQRTGWLCGLGWSWFVARIFSSSHLQNFWLYYSLTSRFTRQLTKSQFLGFWLLVKLCTFAKSCA